MEISVNAVWGEVETRMNYRSNNNVKRKKIKLHGLRRTGTNLLEHYLTKHFDVEVDVDDSGWKHGPMLSSDKPIILTVRHPGSWLYSIWRLSNKLGWWPDNDNFEDFVLWNIDTPTLRTEQVNPFINQYSFAYAYWLWKGYTVRIKMEDMQSDPVSPIEDVTTCLGLSKSSDITPAIDYVGIHSYGRTGQEAKDQNTKWIDNYSDKAYQYLKSKIDQSVMDAFGYSWPS